MQHKTGFWYYCQFTGGSNLLFEATNQSEAYLKMIDISNDDINVDPFEGKNNYVIQI